MVAYDSENQVVFVKNFLRYNGRGRPDLLRKSIKEDMTTINTHLWQDFLQKYPQFINIWQSTQEVVSGSFSKAGSNSSTNSSNDTNNFNIVDHVEVVEAGHNGSSSKPDQEEPDNGSSSQKMIVPLYPEDGKKKEENEEKNKDKDCPHQEIINLYHEILPELPQVKVWNETRQRLLRARWREDPERQNLDWWRQFFEYVRESDFLMGRVVGKDGSFFQADLEWLIRPNNFVKVIERAHL